MLTSCPRCTCDDVRTPKFTWWGGAIGAHLLSHRVCQLCRFSFNARTGKGNRTQIALYTLATNGTFGLVLTVAERLAANA